MNIKKKYVPKKSASVKKTTLDTFNPSWKILINF